ncbi:hypothetical protein C491_06633 [Natronococcus amylolyticus DSM 10524]|uniref:Uncharacterized protein n=1 Tax=Natronococcus amylolyticus DSM 10524 TaxID=1227497 RepID=L9XCL3_9EURY|nr:hypothetical protein C491_06633 [Natronococcus amylolyticus DSM 10524]
MTTPPQTQENDAEGTERRTKAAARCSECGSVYSAWVFSDNTVQPIGLPRGCDCGASEFEAISK